MLRDLFIDELQEFLRGTPPHLWDRSEWQELFRSGIEPLIGNVRDTKRLLNNVRLTYPVVCGEVHAVDFLGIQALRLADPDVYTVVAAQKDVFAGPAMSPYGISDGREERRAFFQALLPRVAESKRAFGK